MLAKIQASAIFHMQDIWGKWFTQIFRALRYKDAMLVSIWKRTNIAAAHQQKHLSLNFAKNAWIYPLKELIKH